MEVAQSTYFAKQEWMRKGGEQNIAFQHKPLTVGVFFFYWVPVLL